MRRSLALFATTFATRQAAPSRLSPQAVAGPAPAPTAKRTPRPIAAARTIADRANSAGAASPILDLEKARSARLQNHPFDYLIAADFIRPEWQDRLIEDYPIVKKGGSFPLSTVKVGADFARLIAETNGPAFR
jgi:hypothetical protein